ncbi:hypothetical protein ACOME3_007617 [Neoechinorhynchus agilis]
MKSLITLDDMLKLGSFGSLESRKISDGERDHPINVVSSGHAKSRENLISSSVKAFNQLSDWVKKILEHDAHVKPLNRTVQLVLEANGKLSSIVQTMECLQEKDDNNAMEAKKICHDILDLCAEVRSHCTDVVSD